jgi:electron transfer flavoprotein beta subunit
MHVVVLAKQVPDTAQLSGSVDALKLMAEGGPRIVNPWDEYAIETAIQLKEEHGGKVTLLSVGKPEAVEALKTGLAMGADEAVLVSDNGLAGEDTLETARVLAAAIAKLVEYDLILSGRSSIDGGSGATPVQLAALLNVPQVSYVAELSSVDLENKTFEAVRLLEGGRESVSSRLPAVISVVKEISEPRYPSFIGIRRAASATIPIWGIGDLDIGSDVTGIQGAQVSWSEVALPPGRGKGVEMIDGSPAEAAATLVNRLALEKVV